MSLILNILSATWQLLLDSGIYILFGLLVGGLLKVFLSPAAVASHLGKGRFRPVLKAAILGIPLPLCSCGVLPAAAALKKQGANRGATTAFLIATPESGVDSITVSYALLDPLMTVARPIAAFITALAAGFTENLLPRSSAEEMHSPDLGCAGDDCCAGKDCEPEGQARHYTFRQKIITGLKFAEGELWADMAGWFYIGLIFGGIITALVPNDVLALYLGGGLHSMLIMLVLGMPLYICATASTPIAAALILKGVSPGTALVFLLAGPVTNMTSLFVLTGLLGRWATARYLAIIAFCSVLLGLLLDYVYVGLGISPQAVVGRAGEFMPFSLRFAGALILLALSVKPLYCGFKRLLTKSGGRETAVAAESCGCHSCQPSAALLPMVPRDDKAHVRPSQR